VAAYWGDGWWGDGWWGSGAIYPVDDWGPSPSLDASPWQAAAQQGGVRPVTRVTVTVPGGSPVELTALSAKVRKTIDPGPRMTAEVEVLREVGQATLTLISTPGAIFHVGHGWHYGGAHYEWRPFGVYVLGQSPKSSRSDSIGLNLIDLWQWLVECRLTAPVTIPAGRTRASAIVDLVQGALPSMDFRVIATGGALGQPFVVERDRAQGVADLARDGGLAAYFGADGIFAIEPDPVLNPSATAASFTDGRSATILDLSTEAVQERIYNAVRVLPITDGDNAQSWSAATVALSDTAHPRHPSKIGLRPAFYSSPTLGSSADAARVGRQRLRALVADVERVEVTTWAQGHREPGETFATFQDQTWADEERAGSWLCESVEHDLMTTLETKITGRSRTDVPTEEA